MAAIALEKVLQSARAVAQDVVAPIAAEIDADARWPEEALRALQQELGGLVLPEATGGLSQGLLALGQVCEVLGAESASVALCFGMHCVGAAVIAAKATPEQQERYLEPISSGAHLTTLAVSEPGTGAQFWLPETALRDEGPDTFAVSGTKTFVTNGGYADSYVVSTVAADADAPPGHFSCVVVPAASAGMKWSEPWNGIGMRGNASRTVTLDEVRVARGDLLGAEGDEIWYVFNVVAPYFLAAMAGTYLGIAAAALDDARAHLSERRYTHTGRRLAQDPLLQHRVGVLWTEVERARRLLYYAASEGDTGGPNALPALCSAKADVAGCVVNVVNEAMTLLGGIGYREGAAAERRLRDARAAHVMAPTTDILRKWTGRAVLGEHILGE